YDANIAITCTNSTEYLKITNEFDTSTDLLATETRSGKLTVEVIKSYVGTTEKPTLDTAISCEITGNAKERTSRATGTPAAKVVHEKSWKLTNDADSNGELSIGDLITLGTESFYVYNVDGDNVKALAQYNLLVGNSSNGSTATPLENVTGLQDASAGAKVDGASNYKGTVAFDDDSKVYETSTIKSNYVDPYMNTLNELGGNVESIGLITYEELTSDTLGCKFNGNTCISSPYDWLYSTSYWIDAGNSMAVNSNGDISNCYYTIDIWYGVRPVITISKSLL
ncbi:MAG TPA: hypothetical protein DCE23_02370, partial [Firmicutes bacterium]|nr:hypothetical protein [Bacillota bacterium]